MKKYIFSLSLLLLAIVSNSCSSDSDEMEPIPDPIPSNITYTNTVKAIMDQNCTTTACHDNNAPAAGLALTTFSGVKTGFQSKGALAQIESGAMPKGKAKLSQGTISKIKGWVANNYKE